ncbi:hypothetical protein [Granulicella sibirica]|uniref:Uncharacterized protein n=1 Tax=Granulicella sibirica TaxID=2479048 RepID=A0A4Q0T002_9BACT|nr:hypothetical protein [Granulicella sibirica]RXH54811.1 hypothetical protein GRAN_3915 [Granulicella sibirica]
MNTSLKQQFYYHADGAAVGGYLTLPSEKVVSSRASASLAQAGGEDSKSTSKIEGHGVFTVGRASVRVHGRHEPENGLWRSVVTSTVEKVNVQEIITADRIVAQLSVMHWADGRPDRISISGTQYLNLRMGGELVTPVLIDQTFQLGPDVVRPDEPDFEALPTFDSLYGIARDQYVNALEQKAWPDWLRARFTSKDPPTSLRDGGSVLCSIVKEVPVKSPLVNYGHVVRVPDFGNVFLGELLVSPKQTHITMLRAELGSLGQGVVSFASAHSNGRTIP